MKSLSYTFQAPLNFPRTLAYIGRFENDRMEAVADGKYFHVLGDHSGHFLVEIACVEPQQLTATLLSGRLSTAREELIDNFMHRTFGSDEDLMAFYKFARQHELLGDLVQRFRGLRVVGISNLWDCLTWSIIGQQVSVHSAFSTRSRITSHAGAFVEWKGNHYEGFPTPQQISRLTLDELRNCGCSRQKADYIKCLAEEILSGSLREDDLMRSSFDEVRKRLLALRGIGPWSVEYAMMRCFADPDACPYEDIGLRNALGSECKLGRQATIDEVKELTESWKPWRGFGTFYIWHTLLKSKK